MRVWLTCVLVLALPSGFRPDVVPPRIGPYSTFYPMNLMASAIVGVRLESATTVEDPSRPYIVHTDFYDTRGPQ